MEKIESLGQGSMREKDEEEVQKKKKKKKKKRRLFLANYGRVLYTAFELPV